MATNRDWRHLISLATEIEKLEPWTELEEYDVFGVRDPRTGEIGYVSTMGSLGEHRAVAVYLGELALARFLTYQFGGPDAPFDLILESPQLQVTYAERSDLDATDRERLRRGGYSAPASGLYPAFRSHRPGWLPWHLEDDEVRRLTVALEQSLQVYPRLLAADSRLELGDPEDPEFLVRTAEDVDGQPVWKDERITVEFPSPPPYPIHVPERVLSSIGRLSPSDTVLQVSFERGPFTVAPPGERPSSPHLLVIVDKGAGVPLAAEVEEPAATPEELLARAPKLVAGHLRRLRIRPKRIEVASGRIAMLLRKGLEPLGIPIDTVEDPEPLGELLQALGESMTSRT